MEFLKRKFRNIKIRSKVIYSCVLIAFIPFCLIGSLGVSISTREMEKNVTQYTMQMVEQILQTVDIYLNSIEKKANMLIRMVEPLHVERIKDSEDPSWEMRQEVLCASLQTVAETHE